MSSARERFWTIRDRLTWVADAPFAVPLALAVLAAIVVVSVLLGMGLRARTSFVAAPSPLPAPSVGLEPLPSPKASWAASWHPPARGAQPVAAKSKEERSPGWSPTYSSTSSAPPTTSTSTPGDSPTQTASDSPTDSPFPPSPTLTSATPTASSSA
jgi:hypothetical protein